MGRSQFMVIQARTLIKTLVFAAAAVVLILAVATFAANRSGGSALYQPGTYTAELALPEASAQVMVTVSASRIQAVELNSTSQALPVFYPLLPDTMASLAQAVVEAQSTAIDLPDGAPVTGQLLLAAVDEALAQARN